MNSEGETRVVESVKRFGKIAIEALPSEILMQRFDRKFICHLSQLPDLLSLLESNYSLIVAANREISPYQSQYYDTGDYAFYAAHRRQKGHRTKVRIRKYPATHTAFIEVKRKSNKGLTIKERNPVDFNQPLAGTAFDMFLKSNLKAAKVEDLVPTAEVKYQRISLIAHNHRERVSIDFGISATDKANSISFGDIAVVEVKTDNFNQSPSIASLRQLNIRQGSFSKYCLSMSLLHPSLKSNIFKPNLHYLQKIDYSYAFI